MKISSNSEIENYKNEISKYKELSEEEFLELFLQYKSGNKEAENRLILHNLNLVFSIATSIMNSLNNKNLQLNFELLDLIQQGNIGLQEALAAYDCERKNKFSTFAYGYIKGYIYNFAKHKNSLIRTPHEWPKLYSKIIKFDDEFQKSHGRIPTDEERSIGLSLDPQYIGRIIQLNRRIKCLDAPINEKNDTLKDIIPESREDLALSYENREINKEIARIINGPLLNDSEKYAITLRFGFYDNPLSCVEIAKKMNICRQRVYTIINNGLEKLRNSKEIEMINRGELLIKKEFKKINLPGRSEYQLEIINNEASKLIYCNSLYDLLNMQNEKALKELVDNLTLFEQEIIYKKFGPYLTQIVSDEVLTADEIFLLYWQIIPKLKRLPKESNLNLKMKH